MTRTLKDYFSKSPQKTPTLYNGQSEKMDDIVTLESPTASEFPNPSPVNQKKVTETSNRCSTEDVSMVDTQSPKRSKRSLVVNPKDRNKRKYRFSSSSSENESDSSPRKGSQCKQKTKRNKKENKESSQEMASQDAKARNSNSILKYFSGPPKIVHCPSKDSLKASETDCCETNMVSKKGKQRNVRLKNRNGAVDDVATDQMGDCIIARCSEGVSQTMPSSEDPSVCKKKPKWNMRLKFDTSKDKEADVKDIVSSVVLEKEETVDRPLVSSELMENDPSNEIEIEVGQGCPKNEVRQDAEIEMLDTNEEVVNLAEDSEQSQSPKLRRSSRIRKPVTKFAIESDSEAETNASKQRKKKANGRGSPTVQLNSESSSDEEVKKRPKKLAPIFVRQKKHIPTPEELAKEAAKLAFLSSGVPDEIKQHQELIDRLENIEHQYVPLISHVQQFKNVDLSWTIPEKKIPFCQRTASSKLPEPGPRRDFYSSTLHKRTANFAQQTAYKFENLTWSNMKKTVREFQKHAQFPFYQMLYRLSKKCLKHVDLPWCEKYRPQCLSDIAFNRGPVEALLDWGKEWRSVAKRKREVDSSDSDESDGDELHRAVLLSGCCGAGKTTGAYAVAEQLGWDFVEVNASSKRSGKHLQLALQEATQSHQMTSEERTSAVLIEDVDLVFSDDEDGYYSTLIGLIASSKRPVVMTTTSNNVDAVMISLKKRISHIKFSRPSFSDAACFLACVCLVEGAYVPYDLCLSLAERHNGDLRTLLSFAQIWIQSFPSSSLAECQSKLSQRRKKEKRQLKTIESSSESEDEAGDVTSELKVIVEERDKSEPEWNYAERIGIPVAEEFKKVVEPLKTEDDTKWWQKLDSEDKTVSEPVIPRQQPKKISKVELDILSSVESYLEHESSLDIVQAEEGNSLLKPWWMCKISEGIGDEPVPFRDMQEQFEADDLLRELTTYGRGLAVCECHKKDLSKCQPISSLGTTMGNYFNTLSSQRSVDISLSKQLELTCSLQRDTVAVDYLPYVRAIYKIESARYVGNTKRGGRFHHYAKSLGLDLPAESVLCLANSLR